MTERQPSEQQSGYDHREQKLAEIAAHGFLQYDATHSTTPNTASAARMMTSWVTVGVEVIFREG